jgi:hypothetical protein
MQQSAFFNQYITATTVTNPKLPKVPVSMKVLDAEIFLHDVK